MSFFRLPIDKLLSKLPVPTEFNESQQAMIDGLNENRFFVHIAGRRTGKSYGAAILAFAKLLEPGQQVMVVAPNFSLSSIIWDYVTDLIKQMELEVDKFNQKDKVVKLVNGSIFRLLSANNRDSLVGRAANLLIVDEAAIIPNDEYFTRDFVLHYPPLKILDAYGSPPHEARLTIYIVISYEEKMLSLMSGVLLNLVGELILCYLQKMLMKLKDP